MPRAPIALTIGPSRWELAAHALLAVAVVGLVGWFAPAGAAIPVTLILVGLVLGMTIRVVRRRPRGELAGMPRASGDLGWRWRGLDGAARWREVTLDCDYLGPWLIGLRLDGRRLWLWPDSADAEGLRELRRLLVASRH